MLTLNQRVQGSSPCAPVRIANRASLLRREYFLDTDLIDQMLAAQVREMRSFLVIRQVCANAIGHDHNESAIVHIKPIRTADELIVGVSYEWAVDVLGQVRLVKLRHGLFPLEAEVRNVRVPNVKIEFVVCLNARTAADSPAELSGFHGPRNFLSCAPLRLNTYGLGCHRLATDSAV
jgi:hypothetical protein